MPGFTSAVALAPHLRCCWLGPACLPLGLQPHFVRCSVVPSETQATGPSPSWQHHLRPVKRVWAHASLPLSASLLTAPNLQSWFICCGALGRLGRGPGPQEGHTCVTLAYEIRSCMSTAQVQTGAWVWSRKQAHHFKCRLSFMRNEFIRGEGGKAALLYERKSRAAPGGPGWEPSTASLGPQSGAFHLPPRLGLRLLSWVAEVGLAHGSWQAPWVPPWPGPLGPCPWPSEVSGHCLGLASVPSAAAASCLGAQWAASSWLPLETCLQGDTVSGPPGVQRDRPVVPRALTATHLHQVPRPQPGGNTQPHPLLPLAGWSPLPLVGPRGPLHRYPHRPLPAPASCPPGSSSWRRDTGQRGSLHLGPRLNCLVTTHL